jgi:hypothetical protein
MMSVVSGIFVMIYLHRPVVSIIVVSARTSPLHAVSYFSICPFVTIMIVSSGLLVYLAPVTLLLLYSILSSPTL